MAEYMVFDPILQEVDEEYALDWAAGFVFSETESRVQSIKYAQYVDTVQGDIDVYYDYGADYYFFVDNCAEVREGY